MKSRLMRSVLLTLALAPLVACLSDSGSDGNAPTSVMVGPAGGALALGPARLVIPPGALDHDLLLTMGASSAPTEAGVLAAVELGPDGTAFAKPIEVTFHFDAASLPEPSAPELMTVVMSQGEDWVELESVVDVEAGIVRATTTHFSRYGMAQRCAATDRRCPADRVCLGHRCVARELCTGGVDEDGDGAIDCQDPDCQTATTRACTCEPQGELRCCYPQCGESATLTCLGENICGYPCHCEVVAKEDCRNGIDDNRDGAVDCKDQDCLADLACCTPNEGTGCCYPTCADGQELSCIGANICGYPCTCVPATAKWYLTCGDPVCRGHDDANGVPPCTTEQAGDACSSVGTMCDPGNDCNAKLVCATADPRQQPGGCPISHATMKQEIRYLDERAIGTYLDEVLRTKLATWRYRFDPERERLGFIIDDDPESMAVDPERQMVDLYGYTSLAIAAIQAQARQIDALRLEVESLQLMCGPTVGPTP